MLYPCEREDWGRVPYEEALGRLHALVAARARNEIQDRLIFCEHEWVITVGRQPGAAESVLDPGAIPVVEIERGGNATLHGPGQLILYPVLLLREGERDLHKYLRNLEEAILQTMLSVGLRGNREGPTGVWINGRKIASLGITARRWVVSHGVALNVDLDLQVFQKIRPCGLDPAVMTSLARELGETPDRAALQRAMQEAALSCLGRYLVPPTSRAG